MKLSNFIFVGCDTARTLVYAQTFKHYGLTFDSVVLLEKPTDRMIVQEHQKIPPKKTDMNYEFFYPDMTANIGSVSRQISDKVEVIRTDCVNDPQVLSVIKTLRPQYIIYSGFGGQIVSNELLKIAPFIHAHAGWLPEYRGSTTIYYSLINEGKCSVSLILLNAIIDAGKIIARKHYPRPDARVDIDYIYDNQIRADLMSHTLINYFKNEIIETDVVQDEAKATTYYVIHPVLKHIALMSLS